MQRRTSRDTAEEKQSSTSPKKAGIKRRHAGRFLRVVGVGLITGAADDDCSAIGTYASAGAKFGPALLWTAPVTFPMMFAVVYLSSKLGQVTGKGLFAAIRDNYGGRLLYFTLVTVLIGNTIEAAADMGGMAAALQIFIPVHPAYIILGIAGTILVLQIWGSYTLIRTVFRWLALALLAYIGSALLAKPDLGHVIRGTLIPSLQFNREFLSILVAIVGTSLSAYLYTWQSNQEVEEEIAEGRTEVSQRQGATDEELEHSRWDVLSGMLFSNVVMYFIILSTAATLYKSRKFDVETAAQAAEALRPLAGSAASVLFAIGIIAVGFLAVPVMTTGAAYDLCQTIGWKSGLHAKPSEAKKFYLTIVAFTVVAMSLNFLGFNPMKALVWAGIVQGFSTPPLLLLIMLMTRNPRIMGDRVNTRWMNVLGWLTTAAIFAATLGLIVSWII